MSKTLSFYNLTGGLNTAQDMGTINSTTNRTESPEMMNIEYYKLGGICTMKGNKPLGDNEALEVEEDIVPNARDILCGVEYIIGNESYLICVDRIGNVFRYDKSNKEFVLSEDSTDSNVHGFTEKHIYITKTVVADGTVTNPDEEIELTAARLINPSAEIGDIIDVDNGVDLDFYKNIKIYGVSYNNGIVFVNGNEALYYRYDGTNETIDVWTPELSITDEQNQTIETTFYPTCVASYRGRLFFGADKTEQSGTEYEGGMLFYSGVGLGTQHTWEESANVGEDAGAFKEFFEDSSNFTGLGTWAEYLVIHKTQNTYILDGTGDLADEWTLKPYSEYTVPSQQSYVIANNGYFSYIPEAGGIHSLLTRNIYNTTFQGGDLSFKIKDTFDYLDTLNYDKIFAVYNPKKKYIMFYMPMLNGNGSNYCYIYDIQTKTWLLRRVPQQVTCAFRFDNDIYIGARYEDSTVKVLKEFSGKTFDGTPIDFSYLTPPFIWGGGTNKTTTKEFRVKLVNSLANHFYLESFKDGLMDSKEQRLVKNINDNLNGLIWDIGLQEIDKTYPDAYESDGTYYQYEYGGVSYYTKQEIDDNNPVMYLKADLKPDEDNPVGYVLSRPIGYWNNFCRDKLIASDSSDYDIEEVTNHDTYAWNQQGTGTWCYKDGDKYAWVDQATGACTANFYTTNVLIWHGIYVGGVGNAPRLFRINPSLLQQIKDAQATGKTNTYLCINNPDLLQLWTDTGWNNAVGGISTNAYIIYHPYETTRFPFVYSQDINGNIMGISGSYSLIDDVNNDEYQKQAIVNNNETYNWGTQETGLESITIDNTVTLLRYPAGDRNTITDFNTYYTKTTEDGTVDIYTDNQCQGTVLTEGTITDGILNFNSTDYKRYEAGDSSYETRQYFKYFTVDDFDSNDTINGAIEKYPYPDDNDLIWEQTLTDTVWDYSGVDVKTSKYIIDRGTLTEEQLRTNRQLGYVYEDLSTSNGIQGDAWLQQGYTTKRMLLPNQYFETIQFKFSGTNNNDSICISGFEVDGIQLAETPWR